MGRQQLQSGEGALAELVDEAAVSWAISGGCRARWSFLRGGRGTGGVGALGDAHLLAEIVRLDRAHHRRIAGDSEIAEHVKIAARAHQTMIWSRCGR